ncbi:MAG: FAD-binding protein [Lachnospiraceae bacterium]|nr:FAD-binding protein [Lachnospiraceae bacterium]
MKRKTYELSRRDFLKGAAASAVGLAGLGLLPASAGAEENTASETADTASNTYADTISWDGRYDVVIVGFGAAGAIAAVTAADAGASVLLLDKAPEGDEGGNTRYCGQMFVYGNENEEATLSYYQSLCGTHEIPEDLLTVYTQKIAHMYDYMEEIFGLDSSGFQNVSDTRYGYMSPEYPEFAGSDNISLNSLHEGTADGFLWNSLREMVVNRTNNIDVWFESPAVRLIQEPDENTVIGVQVERENEVLNIQAINGVILTCGGFENNADMTDNYLGLSRTAAFGSLYNTGDGIRMAAEVGADMWHMDVYEGASIFGFLTEEGVRASRATSSALYTGSCFAVAEDGSRFLREDQALTARHGHLYRGGSWENPSYSEHNWIVFDQAQADVIMEEEAIPEDYQSQIISGNTLEELAENTGMDADILVRTVSKFNTYAESGDDFEFNRAADTMTVFSSEGPYYAIEVMPTILNTQGGPKYNVNAEVLDHDGNAIPHLYSAGELGGICSFQYQGGGNIAECMIFGKIAGENAAAEKEALPEYNGQPVESSLIYTLGVQNDLLSSSSDIELGENEYLGTSHNGMGGDVVVKVTVDDNGTITAVEVISHSETEGIGTKAIEALPDKIVEAGSTDVDSISGATVTSKAILEAVDNALASM